MFHTISSLHKKFEQLDVALRTAFSKVKHDITALQKQQVDTASLKKTLKEEVMRELCNMQHTNHRTPNTLRLTPLHVELLKQLIRLQMEHKRGISMRELASELYPNKEYAKIKSTLSEYIHKLHQAGFVEKMQKERLYLSFTEKALDHVR